MNLQRVFYPKRFITEGFNPSGEPNAKILMVIIAIAAFQFITTFVGSYIDDTLFLDGIGDGFLEHYGVWAILITDPSLLLITSFSWYYFNFAIDNLPLKSTRLNQRLVQCKAGFFKKLVTMEDDRGFFIYLMLIIVGLLSWANNVRQTIDPLDYYGNDVFDSLKYPIGFAANKLNLFFSWVIVYPIVIYFLISISISTRLILDFVVERKMLLLFTSHPDGCYGLSRLGTLNVILLVPYLLIFFVLFSLFYTNEDKNWSQITALITLSVTFIIISYITISPITRLAQSTHAETFENLQEKSRKLEDNTACDPPDINRFTVERLCYSLSTGSPYSYSTKLALNVMRAVPIALTAQKFISKAF